MRSPNGSIHTTQTPPPLSFYNTFKQKKVKKSTKKSDKSEKSEKNEKIDLNFALLCFASKQKLLNRREAKNLKRKKAKKKRKKSEKKRKKA
jgi:hypothetical protein